MTQLMVTTISSLFGLSMVATHAFVDRTWLKWSLLSLEILAYLIVGWLLATGKLSIYEEVM